MAMPSLALVLAAACCAHVAPPRGGGAPWRSAALGGARVAAPRGRVLGSSARRPDEPAATPAAWPAGGGDASADAGAETSVLGAAALVAGTTVGAGILALPAATLGAGFLPSSAVLLLAWLYMASTGLLIAEATVNEVCAAGTAGLGLLATSERVLGKAGARLAGAAYLLIHYALLTAYCAEGGDNLLALAGSAAGALGLPAPPQLPAAAEAALFAGVFGGGIALADGALLEAANSALVLLVVASFGALVLAGAPGVDVARLSALPPGGVGGSAGAAWACVPICILSLVYHNVVPLLATQLRGDMRKLRAAIVGGSAVPLLMFVLWNGVVLGQRALGAAGVGAAGGGGAAAAIDPIDAITAGAAAGGEAGLLPLIVPVFSEAAIITSFVGFVYGLYDFCTDALGVQPGDRSRDPLLYGAILLPPVAVVALDPDVFMRALDTAGTFGISTLFGLLPAAMVWRQRYGGPERPAPAVEPALPGGRASLVAIVALACAVIGEGALDQLGLL